MLAFEDLLQAKPLVVGVHVTKTLTYFHFFNFGHAMYTPNSCFFC